jgi:hypothetical protein
MNINKYQIEELVSVRLEAPSDASEINYETSLLEVFSDASKQWILNRLGMAWLLHHR